MQPLSFGIALPLLLTALRLEAQFQDRLYPFCRADRRDAGPNRPQGRFGWRLGGGPRGADVDPLGFRYFPMGARRWGVRSFLVRLSHLAGLHDAGDHLFVAAEIVDDVLVTEYDRYGPLPLPAVDAFVSFAVDGDKSGGTVREFGDASMVIQESSNVQAQTYSAFAKNYGNDSNVTLNGISSSRPGNGCTRCPMRTQGE